MCIGFRNKEVIGIWGKRNLSGVAGAAGRLLKFGLKNFLLLIRIPCVKKRMQSS